MVFVAALSLTTFSRAEAQTDTEPTLLIEETPTNTSSSNENSTAKPERDARGPIKELRSNIEERREINKDIRNKILEDRKLAEEQAKDARKGALEAIRLDRKDGIAEIRRDIPTSSRERGEAIKELREKQKDARQEVRATYKKEEFAARKTALIARLNQVLSQLVAAYTKVSARVDEAEKAGKDVGYVPALLDEAADKIDAAKVAVTELTNYTPSSDETTSSTDINAEKAREVGENAIAAVKDAHAALKKAITTLVSLVKAKAPAPTTPSAPVAAPATAAPSAVSAESTN